MKTSQKLALADFLQTIPEEYRDFVTKTSEGMAKIDAKQKIEQKASGLTATYHHRESNRILMQFYFKTGILNVYLYPIFFALHDGSLENLPSCITSQINAPPTNLFKDCRSCNPACFKCKFTINGKQYHKCNYGRINAAVNEEIMGLLSVFK